MLPETANYFLLNHEGEKPLTPRYQGRIMLKILRISYPNLPLLPRHRMRPRSLSRARYDGRAAVKSAFVRYNVRIYFDRLKGSK